MKDSNSQKSNGGAGVGFFGLLQLLFIALKLTGNISWGWIWVLPPTWISILLSVLPFLVFFLFRMRILRYFNSRK